MFSSLELLCFILGEISKPFYLASDHLIPLRMRRKIDQLTNLMIEKGFYEFYYSIKSSDKRWISSWENSTTPADVELETITMEQIKRPMVFICGLWFIATLIFIIQLFIFNWERTIIHRIWILSYNFLFRSEQTPV